MDEHRLAGLGGSIRRARAASRRAQSVVAGLAGITPDYLYQIERGKKVPTLSVLVQLANALRVPVSELLGEHISTSRVERTKAGDVLARSLTMPSTVGDPLSVTTLREQIGAAWRTWQCSSHRYSALTAQLPDLIAQVATAERVYGGDQERNPPSHEQLCGRAVCAPPNGHETSWPV